MNPTATPLAPADAFLNDVLHGLSQPQKSLPCKYLYDKRGSQLFDQICRTDEYYPTRTELEIMQRHAESIAYQIDKDVMLVEYGSGSSLKTRVLLDALQEPSAYVPVDISEEHLLKTAKDLQSSYPELDVLPVVADFTQPFLLPTSQRPASHVALYFPGSTIGNFTPRAAGELLRGMASMLGPGGGLLIGIDLHKEVATIESAYNDAQGVTAEFNLNLLNRINGELSGDFELDQFEHKAIYNNVKQRVEISIVSQSEQQLQLADRVFTFTPGEEILTEYSHKYSIEGFAEFAAQYGFSLHQYWTDDRQYFGVLHLVVEQ